MSVTTPEGKGHDAARMIGVHLRDVALGLHDGTRRAIVELDAQARHPVSLGHCEAREKIRIGMPTAGVRDRGVREHGGAFHVGAHAGLAVSRQREERNATIEPTSPGQCTITRAR